MRHRKHTRLLIILLAASLAAMLPTTHAAPGDPSGTPTPDPPGWAMPRGEVPQPPAPAALPAEPIPSIQNELLAPAISTAFNGVGMELRTSGASAVLNTPPDPHAATGPDRIVQVTNGHVAIYSRTGTLLAGGDSGPGAVDLGDFCGETIAFGCFDPKVIYDQYRARFVAVVLEADRNNPIATSKVHMIVSRSSAPANLTSDWERYPLAAGDTISGIAAWFDYPGLGVSPDALVLTGNMFSQTGSFVGTKIRIFDPAELYDGDGQISFSDVNSSSSSGGTVQPAHHFGAPPPGTFYLVSVATSASLRVWALTGLPRNPTRQTITLSTGNQGSCDRSTSVGRAPQNGSARRIDTVCPRMMNAVWSQGSLWATHTGADATSSRAVVRWYEIHTNGYPAASPTLRQQGSIDGGPGEYTYMPAIGIDACRNVVITYTQSAATRFAEMRYTGRRPTDPLNTMQTPVIIKASAVAYDDFSDPDGTGVERWGDYASAVVDPVDQSFWLTHEYARVAASPSGNDGRWGTWHARASFGCTLQRTYLPVTRR